jgi:hypothetical protein
VIGAFHNDKEHSIVKINRLFSMVLTLALCFTTPLYQAQAQQQVSGSNGAPAPVGATGVINLSMLLARQRKGKPRGFSLMAASRNTVSSGAGLNIIPVAAGPNLTVTGSGTLGRLTKWSGFTSSNSVIGDSMIYEDKFGLVGIGTDSPASKLTVNGMIQSLSGGLTFPDGTVQTSSATGALFSIAHDATLKGNGTTALPLGVAIPLLLPGAVTVMINGSNSTGAVHAITQSGPGMAGESQEGHGVQGRTSSTDSLFAGITGFGSGTSTGGIAGAFFGSVRITGNVGQPGDLTVAGKLQVTSGMKMFHIDHPLDPENKYLNHAAIESSEVLDLYSGNVTTDSNGDAVVLLPNWFEALNKDFRYQLTVVGTFAQAIVAEKIEGNRFAIKTNAANVEVSWQVTGVRSDPTARKFKFEVEEEKTERERGFYLNPDAYGQPEEKSINRARDSEGMKQLRERQLEADQIRMRQTNRP